MSTRRINARRWRAPALRFYANMGRTISSAHLPMTPEDGRLGWRHRQGGLKLELKLELKRTLKRTLRLLEGSPCPCWNSTKPSSQHSSPPASWRILHCSRTAPTTSRTHLPGWGSPCREPCSTTPSSELTSPPANLRSHQRNCTDPQASLARSAELAAGWASEEARWVLAEAWASVEELWGGTRGGECGSTTPSCLPSKCSLGRLRS